MTANRKLNLWVDDLRPMPQGYDLHAKTASEAIEYLERGDIGLVSLDHDLGPEEAGTGYDVAKWMEEEAYFGRLAPLCIAVHSANPVGVRNIDACVAQVRSLWERESVSVNVKEARD